jgi:hypothetical protein
MTDHISWAALFEPVATPAPIAEMLPKGKLPCAFCNHPEKMHCKGKQPHTTYKDQARMNSRAEKFYCPTRHCESPICCCVDYQEPK